MIKKLETIFIFIIVTFLALTVLVKVIGVETKVVLSDSMYPSIKTNDLVYVYKGINHEHLKVGDVISYRLGNSEVLHRIVEVTDTFITTKGDKNDSNDTPIRVNEVTGKLIFNLPFGGYLLNLNLWIILIGLYGVIFITRKIVKEFRKG